MSYPVQPPAVAVPAPPSAGPAARPMSVTAASALLWAMAAVGLIYAIVTLTVVPGTVSRFRGDVSGTDADDLSSVVWVGAALATALAVILFALYVVLGLALRRGSNGARIATLVICALGLLAGCGSAATVGIQRSGDPVVGSAGERLSSAYPGGWVGINVALSIAQMLAYVVVGVLVLTAPKAFFGRVAAAGAQQNDPFGRADRPGAPDRPGGFGPPPPGYGPPQPGYGPPPGYASLPGYASPPPGYGPQATPGYGPQASGYGSQTPGYGPPPSGYGPAAPGQGAPQPGYGSPQPGFGVPPAGYGPPQPGPADPTPPGTPGSTPPTGPPARGPEDEYWSRPSE